MKQQAAQAATLLVGQQVVDVRNGLAERLHGHMNAATDDSDAIW
jgi:hypothetical protein